MWEIILFKQQITVIINFLHYSCLYNGFDLRLQFKTFFSSLDMLVFTLHSRDAYRVCFTMFQATLFDSRTPYVARYKKFG